MGVLAIQGDFAKHLEALEALGVSRREIRTPEELAGCTHVIIPGGESTTVGKLLQRFGMGDALIERAKAGMPIWGTCMGMIMLAQRIEDSEQYSLGLLDVTVKRNAFGAQIHSFEALIPVAGLDEPVMGVFIRAPVVTESGPEVSELGSIDGKVVVVRQRNILGTSFHPELTDDRRLHAWFCEF